MKKNVLAFDFGASSGRGILGEFDGERLTLTEIHRFDNNPVLVNGTLYWDVLGLLHEIKQGLAKAHLAGGFESIAVDTWGVDFGLLDAHGDLLQNPVHYRDTRTVGLIPVAERLASESLYRRNGIQLMELNTIYQLLALAETRPELLRQAAGALLMPDLLGYFLSGVQGSEYSIASTTQMLNPATRQWDTALLEKLGIPPRLFPAVTPSGRVLGSLRPEICEELNIPTATVISSTGHDTACAVVAAPAEQEDFIYISCGTWSLFGTEVKAPIISELSERYNITNEGGYDGTIRFHKNIIGLWLIQETRRQYRREGLSYSYAELEKLALQAKPFAYFIDPDAPEFGTPGNLPQRIRDYCARTGQDTPQSVGEIVRCIYESLALKYRLAYRQICECTGRDYGHIHMLGGGTKDTLLCSMAAASIGKTIIAGPIEATAIGNIAVQLLATGDLGSLAEARALVRRSFSPVHYEPIDTGVWDAACVRFRAVTNL